MAQIKCIYGAPCSGKSSYVQKNFRDGDIAWDYDEIKRTVTLKDKHSQGTDAQNSMILQLRYTFAKHCGESECNTAWFICTSPSENIRELLGNDAEYIEMKTTEEECYERLAKDDSRDDKEGMRKLIYKYFHPEETEVRTMPMKPNEREYRDFKFTAEGVEDRKTVKGYASTFNQPYTLYSDETREIREVIDRNAFDEADMSDVILQYDHEGRVFARTSNGTLGVSIDDIGLAVTADLGGTEIGRELYDEIRGGYTTKMSFGFRVLEDKWDDTLENGKTLSIRTITRVGKVYDVSAVSLPANDGTSISVRNLTNGVIERISAERKEALELEKRKLLLLRR